MEFLDELRCANELFALRRANAPYMDFARWYAKWLQAEAPEKYLVKTLYEAT